MKNPHMLETMINLDTRQYRTSENLKKHKNILNRMENKLVSLMSQCVGSYQVSGYVRSDGTRVNDYIRTCGAKHKN